MLKIQTMRKSLLLVSMLQEEVAKNVEKLYADAVCMKKKKMVKYSR